MSCKERSQGLILSPLTWSSGMQGREGCSQRNEMQTASRQTFCARRKRTFRMVTK